MKCLKDVPGELRKDAGAQLNKAKLVLEDSFSKGKSRLSQLHEHALLAGQWIDVSLPVKAPILTTAPGSLHPVTRVQHELTQIFLSLGFTVVDGPEVETEHYNFDALNIPATHPARDMQDTIWAATGQLLRTHTSTMQVRGMEAIGAPLRIVAPGRCFRYERLDATHEHTFYQMDGMMIDRKVTVGHLLYFMKTLLREIFGFEPKIRLRPGYFPFVEPGFELDIWFEDRWMELLPCGLTHPSVLEAGGIDPNEWQGFAFGLGLSRLVMSRFGRIDVALLSRDLRSNFYRLVKGGGLDVSPCGSVIDYDLSAEVL
ncbi:UNVERIFIED_CONTAM: hypothetical protein GTU68_053223 [Idotea baltica]|nr:hypothetical protein [Idotea baltica]